VGYQVQAWGHRIAKLHTTFATHGLPRVIVTDNGSNFTSGEFADFMSQNGIKHIRSAPFHPSSNGLAERAVQSFKTGMKKISDGSVETKLARYLMQYRITPHTTTGFSPAELLMKRRPRCRLDLVRPNLMTHVRDKQLEQKQSHDKRAKLRTFQVGDNVFAKNFARGPVWLPGKIAAKNGPLSYTIELQDSRTWKRHVDHIRGRSEHDHPCTVPSLGHDWGFTEPPPEEEGNMLINPGQGQAQGQLVQPPASQPNSGQPSQVVRKSNRNKKTPSRYGWDS